MALLTRALKYRRHIFGEGGGGFGSGLSRRGCGTGQKSTQREGQAAYPPSTFNRHRNLHNLNER
jgi:hypothetical protein